MSRDKKDDTKWTKYAEVYDPIRVGSIDGTLNVIIFFFLLCVDFPSVNYIIRAFLLKTHSQGLIHIPMTMALFGH